MTSLDLATILGGLALFLHGLGLARDALQGLAADKLRSVVFAVTRNRLAGLVSGAGLTMVLQSSTATAVMLVGFAASGALTLSQSLPLLLGADVGTTVLVQLLSFRLARWALLLAFAGVILRLAARNKRARLVGDSILGLGLVFFGLGLMSEGASPLVRSPLFVAAIESLAEAPPVGVVAGALLSVLLQGSAPALGLLLSLAHGGAGASHLTLSAALPLVLGANLGTAVMPLVSTLGQPPEGKRIAFAHALIKALGVLLFLPLLPYFGFLVSGTSADLARQIANAHTIFNASVALGVLPFTSLVARAVTRLYQPPPKESFGPIYLDPRAIETPALAFGLATREFLRMCDLVGEMLKGCLAVFQKNDLDLAERIEAQDDKVDILNREIRFYLAQIGSERMTPEQAERQLNLINLTADIENAGDTINRGILSMARKKILSGLQFSAEGMADLELYHGKVVENWELAVAAFSTGDEELARKVLRHRETLMGIETHLRQKHIARLHQGLQESLDTSTIHLDLFSDLRRINRLVSNLADAVMASRRGSHEEVRS